jgi:hypothetical protein
MADVVKYWQFCVNELNDAIDDKAIASHMVGVVANENDTEWGEGENAHPAYGIIFELAASLELPSDMTGMRNERWDCIRALVSVLEKHYLAK